MKRFLHVFLIPLLLIVLIGANIYQFSLNKELENDHQSSSWENIKLVNRVLELQEIIEKSELGSESEVENETFKELDISDDSDEQYIKVVNIEDNSTLYDEPIEFKGMVSSDVEKIIVTATGKDVYTLNDFKYGDGNFTYKASTKFGNLKLGSNEFIFEAFFDDDSTQSVIITVFYVEEESD